MTLIDDTIAAIRPPDASARTKARALQSQLTKPPGSLGRLEELHVWAAGVLREPAPALGRTLIVVAAADHGVATEGVSAYPRDVTWQMVQNLLAGGAAINVLAAHAGADLCIVDAGVARDTDNGRLHVAKPRGGTDSLAQGPATSRDEVEMMVERGIALAHAECEHGARAIALGDMGIGNTTVAAAITSAITGAPPRATAGRGTGIDDATFDAKVRVIHQALDVNRPDQLDGLDVLAKVGGFEIAFLAGVALGAAASSVPVILDGYPTTAAALIVAALAPQSAEYMLASHVSAEPGHAIALAYLGLRPLLDLQLRLGEGTGAALALTLLDASLRLAREMATFESAGVARSHSTVRPEA